MSAVSKKQKEDPGHHLMRSVLDDIKHNPGAEMARYALRNPDVLALSMGESDLPTPGFISGEATLALKKGLTHYGPILGRGELREAISNYYNVIYAQKIPSSRIAVTTSGTSAIHLALISVVEKGDEVVTLFPLWKNLLGAIKLQQATVKGVNLDKNEQGWFLDLDKLFDAVSEKTKAIVINTPNNPAGWVMKEHQIKAILEFARQKGLWIISDEVYSRLVYDSNRAPSFLDVSNEDDRLFIINSFSKNWAMTGWRLGWLVFPKGVEEKIYDLVLYDNMGPPNFTQLAGVSALEKGEPFIKEQKERFLYNRDYVFKQFESWGRIRAFKPESGFFAFFQVDGQKDCMELARRLIDEAALGLTPGCAFGRDFRGYLRLCYAVSDKTMKEALGRLDKFLREQQ
jgi:aspartate/methionine/tyrosine aminotransferase